MNLQKIIYKTVILFFIAISFAQADMTIEIVGGAASQIPIAIAPFQADNHKISPNTISALVEADLKRCGLFKTLDTRGIANIPHTPAEIKFSDWSALQAQVLTIGDVQDLSNNRLRVTFRVFDVVRQSQLMAMEFEIGHSQQRVTAHKIADLIYEKLIGEPGDFSTKIAYVGKSYNKYVLQVADADGFNAQTIVSSKEPLISPTWSPDGNMIAYVSFEKKKPVIYVQSLLTGERTLLANFKGNNSAPAWSPDGKKIAIVLTYNANSQIHTINVDGSGLKKLSSNYSIETEPAWSPDGNQIYFTSNRGGSPQVYVMSAEGGDAKRVTFDGNYNVSPHISADGKLLTYIKQVPEGFRVAVTDLQSNVTTILSNTSQDESPSFSPNGRMVLYATAIRGRGTLAAASVDGKIKQVFNDGGLDVREPSWGPRVN